MRRATAALWPVAAAVLVAAAAWQTRTLVPEVSQGVDPSWQAALHLTALRGVSFGSGFVWTYGPLGFLLFPLAYGSWTLLAAFAFTAVVQVVLAYLLIRRGRAVAGAVVAVVLAYLVLGLPLAAGDALVLIVLLLTVEVLEEPDGPLGRAYPATAGVTAALAALTKTNDGGAAILIVAVAAVALWATGRRRVAWTVPVFAVAFLAGWLLVGGSLTAIPDWMRLSLSLVAGYGAAMQTESGIPHAYVYAFAVAAMLLLVAARRARSVERTRGTALLVVAAVFLFASFKEGFVRHDFVHNAAFFAIAAVACVAFAARDDSRVFALLGVAIAIYAVHHTNKLRYAPLANARRAGSQLVDVAHRRNALVRESRASGRAGYDLPASVLGELRGHTVHADPWDAAAVWAYGLPWRPLPVVQSYAAFTSTLDRHDAAFLASPRAPQRILRSDTKATIGGRGRELEAPAQFQALVCNYVQVVAVASWQVLAHAPGRCGAARRLRTLTVDSATPIPVPTAGADELVVAHIELAQPWWNVLLGLAYKPRTPSITLDDDDPAQLIAATASDGIVLHVPAAAGFDKAFGGALDRHTLTVRTVGGRPLTVEFDAVPVRAG